MLLVDPLVVAGPQKGFTVSYPILSCDYQGQYIYAISRPHKLTSHNNLKAFTCKSMSVTY